MHIVCVHGCVRIAYVCVCVCVCVYCCETYSSTPLLSPLPFFLSNTTVLNYSPTHSSLHAAARALSLCVSQTTTDGYTNIGYTILLPPFVVYHGRSQTTTVKTSPLRFETPDVRTSASSFTLARATQSKGYCHYIRRTRTFIHTLVLEYTYTHVHTYTCTPVLSSWNTASTTLHLPHHRIIRAANAYQTHSLTHFAHPYPPLPPILLPVHLVQSNH